MDRAEGPPFGRKGNPYNSLAVQPTGRPAGPGARLGEAGRLLASGPAQPGHGGRHLVPVVDVPHAPPPVLPVHEVAAVALERVAAEP